uniref:Cholesterol side-chain cleavage enzyme, mitochondrial n=1 Tax=Salvator merianae TaxID=96440 RepID=A0A8D0ED34_SALMN
MLARKHLHASLSRPRSLRALCRLDDTRPLGHHGVHTAPGSAVRPYSELPGNWKNNWFNLYQYWKDDGIHNIHNIMLSNFQKYGPIYREKIGTYENINIIDPTDSATLFKAEGLYPERFLVPAWSAYRDFRNKPYGVLLKSGESWRHDRLILNKEAMALELMESFVPLLNEVGQDFIKRVQAKIQNSGQGLPNKCVLDLSQQVLTRPLRLLVSAAVCHVLYGTRLGLLQDFVDPESQRFIDAVTVMFETTPLMLYIPPSFLRRINAKVWQNHVRAWDFIFQHADKCIQNFYRDMRLNQKTGPERDYRSILSNILLKNKMPIEDVKASITEMMAGGVDTTSITLQWAMYELARAPGLQDQLRSEILTAKAASQGDILKTLKTVPLLKATVKETLRLHPVAVTVQRYPAEDIILQNYFIPAKTLVQVGIYAMGRDPRYFHKPEQFNPQRWLNQEAKYFRLLGFGFGPRQCLGRRIAELEMYLFLINMLENFKIESKRGAEVGTTFNLILLPDKPIYFTLRPISAPNP